MRAGLWFLAAVGAIGASCVVAFFLIRGPSLPSDFAACRTMVERATGERVLVLFAANGDAMHEGIVLVEDGNGANWYADVKVSGRKWNLSCQVAGAPRRLSRSEFEAERIRWTFRVRHYDQRS